MTSKYIIYGLKEPGSIEIRYIGLSTLGLRRPAQHLHPGELKMGGNRIKAEWLQELLAAGKKPEIVVLLELPAPDALPEMEKTAIAQYRAAGHRLTNLTDGGESSGNILPSVAALRYRNRKARQEGKQEEWEHYMELRRKGISGRQELRDIIRKAMQSG
jgi:hypothetical protein